MNLLNNIPLVLILYSTLATIMSCDSYVGNKDHQEESSEVYNVENERALKSQYFETQKWDSSENALFGDYYAGMSKKLLPDQLVSIYTKSYKSWFYVEPFFSNDELHTITLNYLPGYSITDETHSMQLSKSNVLDLPPEVLSEILSLFKKKYGEPQLVTSTNELCFNYISGTNEIFWGNKQRSQYELISSKNRANEDDRIIFDVGSIGLRDPSFSDESAPRNEVVTSKETGVFDSKWYEIIPHRNCGSISRQTISTFHVHRRNRLTHQTEMFPATSEITYACVPIYEDEYTWITPNKKIVLTKRRIEDCSRLMLSTGNPKVDEAVLRIKYTSTSNPKKNQKPSSTESRKNEMKEEDQINSFDNI